MEIGIVVVVEHTHVKNNTAKTKTSSVGNVQGLKGKGERKGEKKTKV